MKTYSAQRRKYAAPVVYTFNLTNLIWNHNDSKSNRVDKNKSGMFVSKQISVSSKNQMLKLKFKAVKSLII